VGRVIQIFVLILVGGVAQSGAGYLILEKQWWAILPQLISLAIYVWLYRDVPGPKRLLHNVLALLAQELDLPQNHQLRCSLLVLERNRLSVCYRFPRGVLPREISFDTRSDPPQGLAGQAFREPEGAFLRIEEDIPIEMEEYYRFWERYNIPRAMTVHFKSNMQSIYCWPIYPEGNDRPIAILSLDAVISRALDEQARETVGRFIPVIRDSFEVEKYARFRTDIQELYQVLLRSLGAWLKRSRS